MNQKEKFKSSVQSKKSQFKVNDMSGQFNAFCWQAEQHTCSHWPFEKSNSSGLRINGIFRGKILKKWTFVGVNVGPSSMGITENLIRREKIRSAWTGFPQSWKTLKNENLFPVLEKSQKKNAEMSWKSPGILQKSWNFAKRKRKYVINK